MEPPAVLQLLKQSAYDAVKLQKWLWKRKTQQKHASSHSSRSPWFSLQVAQVPVTLQTGKFDWSLRIAHIHEWDSLSVWARVTVPSVGERERERQRERMGAVKMNSCLWNLDSIQHSNYPLKTSFCENGETCCLFLESCLFFLLWRTEESPFLTSAFLSACLSLYLPPLSSFCFLLLFLLSFSPPSPPSYIFLPPPPPPPPFEKIWLRSKSPVSIPFPI